MPAGLEECRAVFGDEREDYAAALERHYAQGSAAGLAKAISFQPMRPRIPGRISPRAGRITCISSIRWRPPAAFGLRLNPMATKNKALRANLDLDPHQAASVTPLIEAWLPLTFALNNLNRSMGYSDMYPFILSEPVIRKMQYIHEIIHENQVVRKPPGRRRGFFRRAVAPEQPPAPAPLPPGGPKIPPVPGPDIPQENPPIVEPPNDPLPDKPPVELPPDPMRCRNRSRTKYPCRWGWDSQGRHSERSAARPV